MSHTGEQTAGMRDPSLQLEFADSSRPPERIELRATTVIVVLAAAAAIVSPTLAALTHGWDYRLAVILGAWVAVGCFVFGRRTLPSDDGAGRLSLEFAGALAAMLFCAYVSDWLDWRPLGIDDALAGLAVGLLVVIAGPARRALHLAARVPDEAAIALVLLVLAPAGLAYLAPFFGPGGLDDTQAQPLARFAGLGASLILAWTGTAFALRRGLHGTGLVLSALSGLAVLMLLDESGVPLTRAAALGAVAGAMPSLLLARAWCASSLQRTGRLDGLLATLVVASAVSFAVDAWLIGGVIGAAALGAWWWFYRRRGLPLVIQRGTTRINWRQLVLWTAQTVSFGVIYFTVGFLISAAAVNPTGPMLLAMIGKLGLYNVSEFTFAEVLLADQYLWRDEPSPFRRIGTASPERLLQLLRHERDSWSDAELVATYAAFGERRTKGLGLEIGPESPDGLRVAYVFPGSPAAAAGVRRGDVIRSRNGIPVGALGPAGPVGAPTPTGATRLELGGPGRESREVTIARAEYSRPVVSVEKVIDAGGRRVGYVTLHHFAGSAVGQFMSAVVHLRERGVEELVLDLRMNPGGSLSVARGIASAIAGPRLDGKTFQRLVHNERYRDRDVEIAFRAPKEGALSLPRLFVITSGDTCSASEALINGLAPHMTVVTVGATTCGKPVGMTVVEYGARAYSVITFRGLNSRGEGGYFAGLRPTCEAEDDFTHELGDPGEASLAAALHYVRYGRCPQDPVSGAATL